MFLTVKQLWAIGNEKKNLLILSLFLAFSTSSFSSNLCRKVLEKGWTSIKKGDNNCFLSEECVGHRGEERGKEKAWVVPYVIPPGQNKILVLLHHAGTDGGVRLRTWEVGTPTDKTFKRFNSFRALFLQGRLLYTHGHYALQFPFPRIECRVFDSFDSIVGDGVLVLHKGFSSFFPQAARNWRHLAYHSDIKKKHMQMTQQK